MDCDRLIAHMLDRAGAEWDGSCRDEYDCLDDAVGWIIEFDIANKREQKNAGVEPKDLLK